MDRELGRVKRDKAKRKEGKGGKMEKKQRSKSKKKLRMSFWEKLQFLAHKNYAFSPTFFENFTLTPS